MKLNKYYRIARIYPSAIVLLPFLIFMIYNDIDGLKNVFENLIHLKVIGNVTISIVLIFLLAQINRFLGKFLFESYIFKDELRMPTTSFLLFTNHQYTDDYKNLIRQQIQKDFKIQLPDKEEEIHDLDGTRRQIVEAVGLIRQNVKDGRLLLQHNIEYGFARNLIGGSIIGVFVSIIDAFYFFSIENILIGSISIALTLGFAFILIIHKPIINHLGNQYAKRLFQEYLEK